MRKKSLANNYCSLALAAALVSPAQAQTAGPPASVQFGTQHEFNFVSWRSKTSDERGYQIYAPQTATMGVDGAGQLRFDAGIKTAYINSHLTTAGFGGGVETMSDTVVQLRATYRANSLYQPFVTFAASVPTGMATLTGQQKRGIMDADIVYQTRFGEGANFNPGVGVAVNLAKGLVGTVGVGYNVRGAYVPDGDTKASLSPGAQTTYTAGLQYSTAQFMIGANSTYITEQNQKRNGLDDFRPGDSIMVGLTAAVQWDERNQTSGSAAATRTARNTKIRFDDPTAFGLFNAEAQNSNSTVTSANLQHDYRINRDYGLFIRGSYLHRDHNKYDPVSEFYSTAKTKITGEVGISSTLYGLNLRTSIGVLNLKTDEAPDQPAQTSTGLVGSVFATSRF